MSGKLKAIYDRIENEMELERAGFTDALIKKLDRAAVAKRVKRPILLTPSEERVVREHFLIAEGEGGWFAWNGRQLAINDKNNVYHF